MSTIKSKIFSLFKSGKLNVFLLFLLLSFAILILTKLSKTYTNTITFDIIKKNIPENHVVLSDSNAKLNVTIKTFGFNLLPYYLKRPKLNIDFETNVIKNDSAYIWTKEKGFPELNSQFDKQIEVVNINPDTLRFRYDKNLVLKVPIKLHSNIQYSPGYDIRDSIVLNPDSIKVIGPHGVVSKIDHILTEEVILKNIKSNISKTVKLQLPDSIKDIKFLENKVTLKAMVEKFTEGELKIPVFVKNVPDSISLKYYPKEVDVYYYTGLSDFNSIAVKDFIVECDYSKIDSEHEYLTPQITKKPKVVKSTRIGQNRIEFIIIE
ncbi:YbbR-like domain-containing protein [Yeosuana sp. MJ-SS3]|uniref:YbbR-like domain-containing protein n=1 Tax=Gilvirhabdus luticola TaxID=3079858 RepID=A0ABU3UA69_9FLAO|nr:YbbR-like domain-containing protein [Yeosuana sp. MJ-SS3]MDU8887302.1 YbbR-like domain-containing protein [Yeosuana sp. MJ-SS3]